MLILFDQATPVPIRRYLKHHTVSTAFQQGWDRLVHGDLLSAPERAGFDLLLTTGKNMSCQQNLTGRKIAILVLSKQHWTLLRPHVELVVDAVDVAFPGSYAQIHIPDA
jgi:hypothetical protein